MKSREDGDEEGTDRERERESWCECRVSTWHGMGWHGMAWQSSMVWCGVWCGLMSCDVICCHVAHSQSLQHYIIIYWNLFFLYYIFVFRSNLALISQILNLKNSFPRTDHFLNYWFLLFLNTFHTLSSPQKAC